MERTNDNTEFKSAIASAPDPAGDKENPPTNCLIADSGDEDAGASKRSAASCPASNFINALFIYRATKIRHRFGDEIIVNPSSRFLQAHAADLRLYPRPEGWNRAPDDVTFLWNMTEYVAGDGWLYPVRPTAVLHRDNILIACWRLRMPVCAEYAQITADIAGMEHINAPVPLPSEGGWQLFHCEAETSADIDDLEKCDFTRHHAAGVV